ncbi:MAG TPA: hypothetical protein VE732_00690 [Nitrososphaera sp.]|jgi:hypothetical protein|nr:hypothetical protein [Nitrososphaera sp.]
MNALETFQVGCKILDRVMNPQGFYLMEGASGQSSGGNFASGEYVKGDRRLEIHLRYSLGLVTYHIGALSLTHESYMRVLLGKNGGNQYPGFSNDPLEGFRHLSHDLSNFCGDFLNGSGKEFERCVVKSREQEKIKGFKALSS